MHTADWVQAIIGVVGILATGVVAYLVFRLERKDRKDERQQEENARQQREDETAEREQRAIRRERHKDDYRVTTEVLSKMYSIFKAADFGGQTKKELREAGLEGAMRTLNEIGDRVPELKGALGSVWLVGITLEQAAIPGEEDFRRVIAGGTNYEALRSVVVETADAAARQYRAARDGKEAVTEAREALVKEWGA